MKYLLNLLTIVLFVAGAALAEDKPTGKRFVASIDRDGYQRVEMTAGEYYYDPAVVVVKVNVPIELTIKKAGGLTPDNFVIHAPQADLDFKIDLSSEPKKISFMATRAGSYPFECTSQLLFFKSHKERGMHGMLEVVE